MEVQSRHIRGLLVLVFIWTAYFIHSWPAFYESNQYIRLHQAEALVDFGSVHIDDAMARYGVRNEDLSLFKGKSYCDKAIGHPLFGTLAYAVLSAVLPEIPADQWIYLLTFFVNMIPHILGVFALIRSAAILGFSAEASLAVGAVYGLLAPSLLYASLFFGHQLAATSALVAFWLILESGSSNRAWWSGKSWALLLAGFCTSQTVAVEYSALWVGVCLSLYMLRVGSSARAVILFVLGALPWTFGVLLHNWFVFEHPLHTGYHYKFDGAGLTIEKFENTLFGFRLPDFQDYARQLFFPTRGLFFWSPVLLLAIPGLYRMLKSASHRLPGQLCGLIVFGHITLIAAFVDWTAGYTAAPRTLVVMLPFLCLTLAPVIDGDDLLSRVLRQWLFIPLALVSALHLVFVSATFPFHAPVFSNPIYELSLPFFLEGFLARNWGGILLGLEGVASMIPLALATVAILVSLIRAQAIRLPHGHGVVHYVSWIALAFFLMLGAIMVDPPEPSRAVSKTSADILSVMDFPDDAARYRDAARRLPVSNPGAQPK